MNSAAHSIGNDIVDFTAEEPALHERFLQRAFTNSELELIRNSTHLLWQHWAAKEAAYKALARHDPSLIFAHKEFIFDYKNKIVNHKNISLVCKLTENNSYVAALCSLGSQICSHHWIERLVGDDPSLEVRNLATTNIAALYNIAPEKIVISPKNENKNHPPIVTLHNKPCGMLSFSHHGNYIAAAFTQLNSICPEIENLRSSFAGSFNDSA